MAVVKIVVHGDDHTGYEVARSFLEDIFHKRKSASARIWATARRNVCGYTTVASGTPEQMTLLMEDVRARLQRAGPDCQLRFSIIH